MNWLAVTCAALAFWVLGFIWYSLLFGKMWAAALQQHGIKLPQGGMAAKLIGTFVGNFVAAAVMERLFQRVGITHLATGLRLGLALGIGFSGTSITLAYLWQQKPLKVWLVDVTYYVLGAVLLGVILSSWH